MKWHVCLILCVVVVGCSADSDLAPAGWEAERLHGDWWISVPASFEGAGFDCYYDTCWYERVAPGGTIEFRFPVGSMTGFEPLVTRELPLALESYPYRVAFQTNDDRVAALYWRDHPLGGDRRLAKVLVARNTGGNYEEVIWVDYEAAVEPKVLAVLRTIHR